MKNKTILCVSLMTACLLTGCGSGGGGNAGSSTPPTPPPAGTQTVKIYYDSPTNTRLKEEGLVLIGSDGKATEVKHGAWTTYFDAKDIGGKEIVETQKWYANGNWDQTQEWTEYNQDQSTRDTMSDAIY